MKNNLVTKRATAKLSLKTEAKEVLKRSTLKAVPEDLLNLLVERGIFAEFTQGSVINQPGDPIRVALVLSGTLRIYYEHDDGRQLTICRLGEGDLAGAVSVASKMNSLYVAAEGHVKFWIIPPDILEEVLRKFPLAYRAMVDELGRHLDSVVQEWILFAFSSVENRILHWLAQVTDKQRYIRISQQALADEIGTVREVVTRALRRLKNEGKIVSDKFGIKLPDL